MSRRVVVADSSVLIDLERGAFFAAAVALALEFCVPDLAYRRELEAFGGGGRLVHMGLRVLELDDAGVPPRGPVPGRPCALAIRCVRPRPWRTAPAAR